MHDNGAVVEHGREYSVVPPMACDEHGMQCVPLSDDFLDDLRRYFLLSSFLH